MSVKFLQEVGLMKTSAKCKKCGIQMKLNTKCDKWRCNKKNCNTQLTTRYESLFNNSNLTYEEIMFLLYEILNNTPGNNIKQEYNFDDHTLSKWRSLVRSVLIFYVEMSSTQIGGPGKVIEIDESKFGKQKYYKGRYVQGQWVFGGVERGTGLCFLVPIEDRSEQTLLKLIKKWVKPGTTIISDCWKSYNNISEHGFNHLTVNHSVQFVNKLSGAHTNTIESTWRHVKASLPQYHRRKSEFTGYLATYIFNKECSAKEESRMLKFIHLASCIQWD